MELLNQIEQAGEAEAERILADAAAQAKQRLEQAEREIAAWIEAYRRNELHQIEQEKRLIISRARAQARGVFLKAKSRVAEVLFERLLQETGSLRKDSARYKAFLERCLREAEREIQGPLVLHIDPADEAIVRDLIRGTAHQIGEKIRTRGGFIATNAQGNLVLDNRLETRIANLRQRYRPELGKALFNRTRPD
jgi:vacuolar-type H+-ATPase subunit E/Vma4